jgi:thioredoxin reductase
MSTNQLYDVIVIGASEEGINFCTQLINKTKDVKVALVSRNFNRPVEVDNITKINQEVIFSSYIYGLISLTLADRTQIFGKNVVIAVGTKPVKSTLKNSNIKYNLNDLKASKTSPVVVAGNDTLAVKYALALAKKFKYVYLCSNTLNLECEKKYIKKLENVANIVHLPNCNIIGCKNNKDGSLAEAQLDTYSSIKCAALVMSLGRNPDNSGLSKRMIDVDSEGYIITKEFNETTIIPGIYAIGACTRHGIKNKLLPIINHLINKNKFELREE